MNILFRSELEDMNLQPREKFVMTGLSSLNDCDLLALLINTGYKEQSAVELSKYLLDKYQSVDKISKLSVEELSSIKGIGKVKAMNLLGAIELGKRSVRKYKEKNEKAIKSSRICGEILIEKLKNESREHFLIVLLNVKNIIQSIETISIGSLNSSIVHPREVFKKVIDQSAASIILCHNHPSGDLTPSNEDLEITKRLVEGGNILGIDILDHIIVNNDDYLSFKEEELI